jgi:hypothetical protein
MDEAAFRAFLATRHLEPEAVERSVSIVARFEQFLRRLRPAADAGRATAGDVRRFVEELTGTGENTQDNVLAIARYAKVARNDGAIIAALELIDGVEVPANLARKLADLVGEELRDEVFAGLEVPPVGAAPAENNAFMRALMDRLLGRVDAATASTALTSGLHYVPREVFAAERERYLAAPDIDWFIEDEHRRYIDYLAGLKSEGALYYTQPITDDVLVYVRDTPTCGGGVRDGDVIRTTKIPYQADQYLHEVDAVRRRYLYCHCLWARESILHPGSGPSARFCQCSAGFEKQYWDAVFDQPVQVDVVRSVLQGDDVCEFAVHLPDAPQGQVDAGAAGSERRR